MKPWFILIGLAVGITAVLTVAVPILKVSSAERGPVHAAPPRPDGPAPTIEVEGSLTYNFGVLPQHYKGTHSWVFKNTGAGPLEIRGEHASCSCTTSDLFEEKVDGTGAKPGKTIVLPPGGSRAVGVSFETRTWDKYNQNVTIDTNDPAHPQVVLKLEGVVRPAISTVPLDPSMNFLSVSNDEPSQRRIYLYSVDRPDLKLLKVACSNPSLVEVQSRPMTAEELAGLKVAKGYAIEATVKPSTTLGNFKEEVVVETDHPIKGELKFAAWGRIIGPITATPEKVTMNGASSSDGGSAALTLWARGRTSVNFTVTKKPIGMDVAIEPIATVAGLKGSKYRMTVKLIPGIESGRIADDIVLKTDDPKVSEFRVPVDVLVQGSR